MPVNPRACPKIGDEEDNFKFKHLLDEQIHVGVYWNVTTERPSNISALVLTYMSDLGSLAMGRDSFSVEWSSARLMTDRQPIEGLVSLYRTSEHGLQLFDGAKASRAKNAP